MKPRIYIDTSVVSYLTARPVRDAVALARQIVTAEWWSTAQVRHELVVSDFVHEEAAEGDPDAARRRLDAIGELTSVDVGDTEVENLAQALTQRGALPASARFDALHIAAAACNGVEFLATWNYQHLANPAQLGYVEKVCAELGYRAPRIVTPDQLAGANEGENENAD